MIPHLGMFIVHIAVITLLLMSGIMIAAVKGVGRPVVYIPVMRFVNAGIAIVNMLRDNLYRNLSIKYISSVCGFKRQSIFSALFKTAYGKTPTEWREGEEAEDVTV